MPAACSRKNEVDEFLPDAHTVSATQRLRLPAHEVHVEDRPAGWSGHHVVALSLALVFGAPFGVGAGAGVIAAIVAGL